jgi:HlyD family secretion protein
MNGRKPVESNRWGLSVLVVIALLIVCGVAIARRVDPVEIRAASPRFQDFDDIVTTNGMVVPIDEFQARANFPGVVEKVYVELGDKVKPGQLVVRMKDPFASARVATANSALQAAALNQQNIYEGGSREELIAIAGDLSRARIEQTQASADLEAVTRLQQRGAASAAEVKAARQRLDLANATLQTQRKRDTDRYGQKDINGVDARVADAKAALASADMQFQNANITTPIAGTVYSLSVLPWDFVGMGADMLRIADLNQVQIRAYFDEPEVGKLKAGQPVIVTWDGRPGVTWHGHIKQAPVAAMALGTRSVAECIVKVDDAKGDLLPNTNVKVAVTIDHRPRVLTIPREALRTNGDSDYVYRVVDGKLVRTPLDIGLVSLDRVEITHGLSAADVIALHTLDSRGGLSDNLPVKPVP